MTKGSIKSIYQQFADAVNRRDLDSLNQIFDSDLINHGADPDEPTGAYHFIQAFENFIAACPDFQVTVACMVQSMVFWCGSWNRHMIILA